MRMVLALVLALMASLLHAQQFTAPVITSECELVAKSGSATGAIVGSGVGAGVGSIVGGALFGRTGRALGALAGGVGGGLAGENMAANRTYSCLLTLKNPYDDAIIYVETTGRPRNAGEVVRVFRNPDNTFIVR